MNENAENYFALMFAFDPIPRRSTLAKQKDLSTLWSTSTASRASFCEQNRDASVIFQKLCEAIRPRWIFAF
jgi:hypothetical protein